MEPSLAERARTLLHLGRTGTLATISRKHAGHPFASVMPYAVDEAGRPIMLISALAVHARNLLAEPRASLLVAEAGGGEDPLAHGRVTLIGQAVSVPEGERAAAREHYLARHPDAADWVEFGDFSFWRLEVADVYIVVGFGSMGWVEAAEYRTSRPDPLAETAAAIIDHMNRDHGDALVLYARAFGGAEADEAAMTQVDRLGFTLRLAAANRQRSVRIPFPHPVASAAESRAVLIEMLRAARAAKPS